MWSCVCDCGKVKTVHRGALLKGSTKSCGSFTCRPGITGNSLRPEYNPWYSMIDRCRPDHRVAANYYARGIRVCDRWSGEFGFENFLSDMGPRPGKGYSIDRINNDGIYEPGNCRWATAKQQIDNRRKVACLDNFSDEEIVSHLERKGWTCQKA